MTNLKSLALEFIIEILSEKVFWKTAYELKMHLKHIPKCFERLKENTVIPRFKVLFNNFMCMHMCVHVLVYMWKCRCRCVHRGQMLTLAALLNPLHFIFFDAVSHCSWSLPPWLDRPTNSRDSLSLPLHFWDPKQMPSCPTLSCFNLFTLIPKIKLTSSCL